MEDEFENSFSSWITCRTETVDLMRKNCNYLRIPGFKTSKPKSNHLLTQLKDYLQLDKSNFEACRAHYERDYQFPFAVGNLKYADEAPKSSSVNDDLFESAITNGGGIALTAVDILMDNAYCEKDNARRWLITFQLETLANFLENELSDIADRVCNLDHSVNLTDDSTSDCSFAAAPRKLQKTPRKRDSSLNRTMPDECVACLDAVANVVIIPCAHRCICDSCVEGLLRYSSLCPICRTEIEGHNRSD